ncbi:hypothetical protein CI102_12899 [Trichoderma harzianum]|nr:hypothetical protein CI102_12899 [Trichoderma harzianum]
MPKEKTDDKGSRVPIPEDVKFRMDLHRALLRGNGFYDVLVRSSDEVDQLAEALATAHIDADVNIADLGNLLLPDRLLVSDLITLPDEHLTALMEEVLPEDRTRFIKYMSERPLGLGCITAGPGFGKTTALAVATLAMTATIGPIYGTAPTHVATDNFAERLHRISKRVTERRNKGKATGDRTRARRVFVVRGYIPGEEYGALLNLLRDPSLGDNAASNRKWRPDANWKLGLSPSFWLLKALRFRDEKIVAPLHEDDPKIVFEVQARIDTDPKYKLLRDVATGAISFEEYIAAKLPMGDVMKLVKDLVNGADILCTTPSLSCKVEFETWKNERAKGIAVDEAGNINRPDLYRVWGNTMLPCLLGGDDMQLPPTVMTKDEKDGEGNHRNRQAQDGTMSALEFFRSSGWPIYRLRTQLRMAKGLFDTCHREVYSDVPFNYGTQSALANHTVGVNLERYLKGRFPRLAPPAAGSLSEVFVHCEGTVCIVDEVTHSKRNPDQVANALDFLADVVKVARINAADIAIITPYAANVALVNRLREKPEYEILAAMPPAATVDSFQGREADIMVVIMGTTREVGPGFTTDRNRLNVMLSRQKSGLIVFGDINVVDLRAAAKTMASGRRVVKPTAFTHAVKEGMLHNVLRGWQASGRVVTLPRRSAAKAGPSKPGPPKRLEKYIAPL